MTYPPTHASGLMHHALLGPPSRARKIFTSQDRPSMLMYHKTEKINVLTSAPSPVVMHQTLHRSSCTNRLRVHRTIMMLHVPSLKHYALHKSRLEYTARPE